MKAFASVAAIAAALLAVLGALIWGPWSGNAPNPRNVETRPDAGVSGIRGMVVFGGCDGPIDERTICPVPEPIRAKQEVLREGSGDVVTKFASSRDGEFEVPLPPGRYLIVQSLDQPYRGSLPPVSVAVPKGEIVDVTVFYDNGLR